VARNCEGFAEREVIRIAKTGTEIGYQNVSGFSNLQYVAMRVGEHESGAEKTDANCPIACRRGELETGSSLRVQEK
jgi:hypothetical protein